MSTSWAVSQINITKEKLHIKAAVLHNFGETPRYEDFPDPIKGENELLIHVNAVALENVDKAIAKGSHFASQQFLSQFLRLLGLME